MDKDGLALSLTALCVFLPVPFTFPYRAACAKSNIAQVLQPLLDDPLFILIHDGDVIAEDLAQDDDKQGLQIAETRRKPLFSGGTEIVREENFAQSVSHALPA
jgi:hypothetical protein